MSHNILSGNHQLLSKSDNGTVSEGLWGELCDFSGIVNGSVTAWELEDGWIVCLMLDEELELNWSLSG